MSKREMPDRIAQLEVENSHLLARLRAAQEVALRLLQQWCNPPPPNTSIPWHPPVVTPTVWMGDVTPPPNITYTTNAKPGEPYRYANRPVVAE